MFQYLVQIQEERNRSPRPPVSTNENSDVRNDVLQSQFLEVMRDKARLMDQITELNSALRSADKKIESLTKENKELEEKNKQCKEQVEIHRREADLFLIEIGRRDDEIKNMDNYQKTYLKEVDSIKSKDYILNEQIKQLQASLYHMSNYIQKLNNEYKTQMMNVCNELEHEQQRSYSLEQQLNQYVNGKSEISNVNRVEEIVREKYEYQYGFEMRKILYNYGSLMKI
ncbi:predicted protein [Naegleria gruberi]|uniref:Predicted protein n=1 Tax=Naegleria gruberi TaxID=5762 RepID=D2VG81_NAEGR|nr:uncharacterized protein NAEGRDRAFT_67885 [Naegleria gruberi]EFC44304.1 predicted protein [Naegleria gruberi]|eukprot:XP_002677048.1 predicted protein [Naegleria gruberi strain NEG-M]